VSSITAADDSKINQLQRKADEMKRVRRLEPVLLVAAAAVAGCGAPPVAQAPKAPAAKAMSCTERSAAARPPKNPIVELAWCIAETDNLYDPDHLFHETLGIRDYGTSEGITWGVKAGAGANKNKDLPKGIGDFFFTRKSPKGLNEPGNRYLSFDVDPRKSCVRMADIAATFGEDYWLSAVPISVPAPALAGASPSLQELKPNPYGIFYKSPRLFMRDASGSVNFDFRYGECVVHIDLQRSLDLVTYRRLQEKQ